MSNLRLLLYSPVGASNGSCTVTSRIAVSFAHRTTLPGGIVGDVELVIESAAGAVKGSVGRVGSLCSFFRIAPKISPIEASDCVSFRSAKWG
jgi:hypothetical protein